MRRALVSLLPMLVHGCGGGGGAEVQGYQVHEVTDGSDVGFRDVWVLPAGDVFAVGERPNGHGAVLRFDGETWTALDTEAFVNASVVWANAVDDVWVGGLDPDNVGPTLLRWDGLDWTGVDAAILGDGARFASVADVWGTGSSDVWVIATRDQSPAPEAAVFHWDGASWTEHPRPWPPSDPKLLITYALTDGCSVGVDDAWIVGYETDDFGWRRGSSFHWDGASWAQRSVAGGSSVGPLVAHGISCRTGEIWTTQGDGEANDFTALARIVDDDWHQEFFAFQESEPLWLLGVWIAEDQSVSVVGGTGDDALVWTIEGGQIDESLSAPSSPSGLLSAVSGDATGRVWAVGGEGLVLELERR